jgi:autotransporter-associated beta strand protein
MNTIPAASLSLRKNTAKTMNSSLINTEENRKSPRALDAVRSTLDPRLSTVFTALFFAFALLAAPAAFATTYDWVAAAGSGNLTGNATNWSPAPSGNLTTTDIAQWGNVTYTVAPTANANWTVGELHFAGIQTGGVTFGSGANTITLSANATGSTGIGIQMDSGSGAVSTGSAKFALGAAQSWINNSASALTVGGTINAGGFLLTLNGTGATALSGVISGSGGALSISNGTVTLGGNNTFTGGITLNSGTLKLGSSTTGSLGVGGALTINGGTVDVTGARTTPGNNTQTWNADWTYGGSSTWNTGTGAVTLNATSIALTNSGASALTVGGTATGTSNLTLKVNAGGAITLADINNTGTITNSGTGTAATTLTNVGSNVTGITENSTTSALTVTTLNVAGGGTTLTNALGNKTLTISNTVVGTGNLTIANNSATNSGITFTAGANNTGTIINNGTGAGTTTIPTVGANVTGIFQNASNSSSTLTITNALTGLGGTNTFNISKSNIAITGSAGLTLTGGVNNIGTITNDNTGTGTLTIGAIGTNVTNVTQNSATSTMNLNGVSTTYSNANGYNITLGTLKVSDASVFTAGTKFTLASGGRLDVNVANQTLAKLASGTGSGVVAGSYLRYSQVQTSGTTGPGTILGTVELNTSSVNPNYTLDFGNGSTLTNLVTSTYTAPITLSGNASIDSSKAAATYYTASGVLMISGSAITGNTVTLTLNGSNTDLNQINGVISDGVGGGKLAVVKDGTGTWSINPTGDTSVVNSYSGGTTLNAGLLRFGKAGSFGTGALTINGGSIDAMVGITTTTLVQIWNGDFTFVGSNAWNANGGGVTLGGNSKVTVNASTLTIGGSISDGSNDYNLTKAGAGNLTLSTANTITGNVTVAEGTLKINNTSGLNVANVVTVGGNATAPVLDISQSNTIAGLNDGGFTNGTVTNTGGTQRVLTLGGSGTYSYGGIITATTPANLKLTKNGTGTQTLGGTNTYAGATLVSQGTLIIDGSLVAGSAVSVSSLATLGGIGTVNGLTTLSAAGSIINPGTAGTVGSLALTGGLTASSGGAFHFDLSGGVTDHISLGAGVLTAGATWTFTLNNLGGMSAGTPYTLLSGTGTWSSTPTLVFNLLGGLVLDTGYNGTGYKWDNTLGADSLTVQFSAIPEPSTWALLAFSLTVVTVLRRRRNS